MHAEAIYCPRPRVGEVAMPHFVGVFPQIDAFEFVPAVTVEETQLDFRGVC